MTTLGSGLPSAATTTRSGRDIIGRVSPATAPQPATGAEPLDAIADPVLRAAARRFEVETGGRLATIFAGRLDDPLIGLFLILAGYPPVPLPAAVDPPGVPGDAA